MRISVSDIDSFQYWKTHDWMSETDLSERLHRLGEPPNAILVGRALHEVMENAPELDLSGMVLESESGLIFDFSDVNLILTDGPKEVSTTRIYQLGDYDVELSGRVDAIDYDTVIDYKTTSKALDIEKSGYYTSFQWRAYLDMMSMHRFLYVVLEINKRKSKGNVYKFRTVHDDVDFYSYERLSEDVRNRIREFVAYVKAKHPDLVQHYIDKYEELRQHQERPRLDV